MQALVVDDDATLRFTVKAALEMNGYAVDEARDGKQAITCVSKRLALGQPSYDIILLDVNMPNMNGIEALSQIKEMSPRSFCLVLTAFSNVKDAVTAIKRGAFDYLEKPVTTEQILDLIKTSEEANEMVEVAANSAPQVEFDAGRNIIGGSSSIQKVFDVIYKLSKVDTSVLIRGESGTGKELVARALHYNSHRKKGPFQAVNCAAIPENLIESELFGHEKGAFTSADRKKIGKFQFAEGGTLFLDEIGDISQQMQVKLLRVLQEKVFTPVGSNTEIKADVRIIAATNRPLEQMMENDSFRADLFYRLNVLPIILPPLRDRREDIKQLCGYFIKKFNNIHNRRINKIDKLALNALRLYGWPGNIRELENVIEHAFIVESSDVIHLEALPDHFHKTPEGNQINSNKAPQNGLPKSEKKQAADHDSGAFSDFTELNYPILKEKFEKDFLVRALKAFDGRINQTAEHTKMTKVTLLRKLEKYGISPKEFNNQ